MNWAFSQCLLKLKFSARAEATTNAEVERFNGLPSNHSLKIHFVRRFEDLPLN